VRSHTFTTDDPAATVHARIFIARDSPETRVVASRQTVVVAQWYAFDDGGHFSTAHWFWRDQWAQLRHQRVPWVAVSLRLPVDPSSTLDDVTPQVTELSQAVQTSLSTLMNKPPD
jgi:cyanoexosortase B-associated protein